MWKTYALTSILLVACGSEPAVPAAPAAPAAPTAPTVTPPPTAPPAPTMPSDPTAPAPTPAVVDAPPGPHDGVYLVVNQEGLVRLGASGVFEVVEREIFRAHAAPGGWVGLRGPQGPVVRSGGEPIEPPHELTYLWDVAAAPDGSIWLASSQGLAHWTGGAWTVVPREGGSPFQNIVVDGLGAPWMLSGDGTIHRMLDGHVVIVEGASSVGSIAVDPAGRVVVSGANGVARRDGDAWTSITSGPMGAPAFHRDGAMVLRSGLSLSMFRAPGTAATPIQIAAIGGPVAIVNDAGFDGAGRLWLQTHVGVIVLEASLDRVARWYPTGTVPLLTARDGTWGIFAVGHAPELPAALPAIGHVRGRIVRDGAPLADAMIELCTNAVADFDPIDGSPCRVAENPYLPTALTGPDGSFELVGVDDMPLDVAIDVGVDAWAVASDTACCERTGDGVLELGTIEAR